MQGAVTIKGIHLGEQDIQSDEDLIFCKQMGVEYVYASPLQLRLDIKGLDLEEGYWNADSLMKFREHIESFDLKLGMMSLPIRKWPSILFGTSERDRDIEQVCKCIEAAGKAGIPLLGYHLNPLPGVRSSGRTFGNIGVIYSRYGRGGIMYSHFDYDEIKNDPPHPDGPISAEQAWERIEYFIERVIPVAEEYNVKMAGHPNDPPLPPGVGYRGIELVLNSIDGLKRFADLSPSPYHGIIFCQGCVAEMCTSPEQVYDTIRYFSEREKIFWVHLRNIRGNFLKFDDAIFPDEGDIDMLKAMRTYKEVGYNGVVTSDHVPHSKLDTPWGHRSHAFCLGYIRALIQTVESEN